MFGFSFQKLLVLAAIIAIVWYGFKLVSRLDEARKAEARLHGAPPKSRWSPRRKARGPAEPKTQEMVQCPICEAYVPAGHPTACGRADCPY